MSVALNWKASISLKTDTPIVVAIRVINSVFDRRSIELTDRTTGVAKMLITIEIHGGSKRNPA